MNGLVNLIKARILRPGDLIVGGPGGDPRRLPSGTSGQTLVVQSDKTLAWATPSSGFSDPMTTRGDIIVRDAANATARLGRGSAAQVLTSDGTDVAWAAASSGFSDPMTTRGDIIVRNAANATARLGRGSASQVLTSDGTDVAWATPASGSDDTIPSGGTLYNGTSTAGWTGGGSPDTFDADTTVPGAFYLSKTSIGSNNLVVEYRSTSAFPRTYTMRVKAVDLTTDFHGAAMVLGEAGGAGKFLSWGIVKDGAGRYMQRYLWTTLSASGTNASFGNTSGTHTPLPPNLWIRIVVNSTTDIELWVSYDGYIYHQWIAAYNPAFTIAVFGFGQSTFNGGTPRAAFDWIHES